MTATCTWAEKAELPELEKFILQHYGSDSVQAQSGRFKWLFADNPAGMHVLTGRIEGKLVAVCGHLPVSLSVNGQSISAAYGVDFLVDPEHRRKGIARLFLKERLKRFDISLSSGQSPAMANVYKGEKTAILGQFQRGLFVRRPQFSGGPKSILRESIAWGLGLLKGEGGQRSALTLDTAVQWLRENEQINASIDFFRWRFDCPLHQDYQLNLLSVQNQSGLLVTRGENNQEVIVGLFCEPCQRSGMLGCAARTSHASRVIISCSGDTLTSELKQQGFLVRPADAWVVAMSQDSSLILELEKTPWVSFAAESDSDLLRFGNTGRS